MARNRFENPATGEFYEWHRNHESEESAGKTRAIAGKANTGNTGRVRQQGASEPYVLKLKGRIVHRAQHVEMWTWYELCETQTIRFVDHEGFSYIGQVSSYQESRIRKERSASPDLSMQQHYFEYELEFQVYSIESGDLDEAGVSP